MGVVGPVRVAVAFVLAAVAAAALAGVVSGDAGSVKPAFFVALAHAFLFGVPAYYALRSRGPVTWLHCMCAGFVIGGVPLGLWSLSLGAVFLLGSHGAFAGLVFWPSLRLLGGGRDRAARGDAGPVSCGSAARVVGGVPVAVAAAAGIFAVDPGQVVDQTCHNPLRDRRSVCPELRAHLRVDPDEWPGIVAAFEESARANDWSLRQDWADEPQPLRRRLSICDPAGTQIVAWYFTVPDEPRRDERHWGVRVTVYQPQGGASWRAPTRDLLVELRRRWPGRMGFTDDMGYVTDPPDSLAPEASRPDAAPWHRTRAPDRGGTSCV